MKKIIIGVLVLATLFTFRFSIVENGKGYYIENGNKAFVIESVFNPVEPVFLLVIE